MGQTKRYCKGKELLYYQNKSNIEKDAKVLPDKENEGDMKLGAVGVNWFMSIFILIFQVLNSSRRFIDGYN